MFKKYPETKGYLLTYLGWGIATLVSLVITYFAVTRYIADNSTPINVKSWDTYFDSGVTNLGALIFAALILIVVFQICLLTLTPFCVRRALRNLPKDRKTTIVWLDSLLFLSPFIYLAFSLMNIHAHEVLWIVVLWILLSPFLARYIATQQKAKS